MYDVRTYGRTDHERKNNKARIDHTWYCGGAYLIGPTVHTKTYILPSFYQQYLVLLTMAPLNSNKVPQEQNFAFGEPENRALYSSLPLRGRQTRAQYIDIYIYRLRRIRCRNTDEACGGGKVGRQNNAAPPRSTSVAGNR